MTTRRSFFASLAALLVAPKVLPAVTRKWDPVRYGGLKYRDWLYPTLPRVEIVGLRNLIDDGTLIRISGVSRSTYPDLTIRA